MRWLYSFIFRTVTVPEKYIFSVLTIAYTAYDSFNGVLRGRGTAFNIAV